MCAKVLAVFNLPIIIKRGLTLSVETQLSQQLNESMLQPGNTVQRGMRRFGLGHIRRATTAAAEIFQSRGDSLTASSR